MVTRIATFVTNNSLFGDTLRLQSNYALLEQQSSSGLIAPNGFSGIANDAQSLLGLESQISSINSQANNIKYAQNNLNASAAAVSNIGDVLNKISSVFSNVMGLPDNATNVLAQATAYRDQLVSLLNTQVAGVYLFGGTVQNQSPVDITAPGYNTTTPSPTVADTNYYKGDSTVVGVRASSTLNISYGVTANNPAFEQALRALNIAIANPTNLASIGQAFDLTKSAINGVADIAGGLNAKGSVLTNEASYQNATLDYMSQSASALRDADVAAATVQATQIETQLQSSYGILSKVLNLRLSDYLK